MKRIGCGVLLIVVAVCSLMTVVVLPSVTPLEDIPQLNAVFQSVLCEKGETLSVERYTFSRPGTTSYSAAFNCTLENRTRDVTGRITAIGIAIFLVPLLTAIFMIISGASAATRRAFSAPADWVGSSVVVTSGPQIERLREIKQAYDQGTMSREDLIQQVTTVQQNWANSANSGINIASGSAVERLKELKAAYDQGLITETEYESKRQAILKMM